MAGPPRDRRPRPATPEGGRPRRQAPRQGASAAGKAEPPAGRPATGKRGTGGKRVPAAASVSPEKSRNPRRGGATGSPEPRPARPASGRGRTGPPLKPVPVVPVSRRGQAARRAPPVAPVPPPAAAAPANQSQKLQKVLAQAGMGSRREMETLIEAGKVLVNGQPASLGMRVSPDDLVKVGRRQLRFKLSSHLPRVIVYHKPEGEIVTRSDPAGRPSVFDHLPAIRSGKWLALGRLDYNTCGLMIFTTSGELANRITHPRFEVEREYAVRILGELTPEQQKQLLTGVNLTDGPAHVDALEEQGGTGRNRWYRVIVREGRNRLVRRLFEHFGHTVSRLMRVRFGIINLPPHLKRGQHRELTEGQTRSVLEWLALGPDVPPPPAPSPAPAATPRGRPRPAPRRPGRSR